MTSGSLMKVESIAECSPRSILQYLWPALSDDWSRKIKCSVILIVAVLHGFYCTFKMDSIVQEMLFETIACQYCRANEDGQ